ncbi:MAG: hypothetical protein Q8934_20315 [Bacillota bacterium]|nr:hypothetical protein [Bacillota bacterium]
MFKKVIILVMLLVILIALLLVKAHTVSPVTNTSTNSNDSSGYLTKEYKISKITGNEYYGKCSDGTGIHFSAKNIASNETIQVNDEVIAYFDKNDLGEGLVKVEKK